MKTYTFTITISETETEKPLSNSILERQQRKADAKKRADEINQKFRELRFKALEPYLKQIREQITEPLGLKANLYKVENWVHKNSIIIGGDRVDSRFNICLYIENKYYTDEFGNSICQSEGFKMYVILGTPHLGSYQYDFKSVEQLYTSLEKEIEKMYIQNRIK